MGKGNNYTIILVGVELRIKGLNKCNRTVEDQRANYDNAQTNKTLKSANIHNKYHSEYF